MIEYQVVIDDNDYLWDNINNRIVKYQTNGSVLIGSVSSGSSVQVAFPIPLNEDVLKAIDFVPNGRAEYVKGEYVIRIEGTKPESILQLEDTPVRYVSDVQNFCRSRGSELTINERQLENACLKNYADSNT